MDLLSAKRKLLPMGGFQDSGGGGGGQQTTVTDLPEWAKGTAQKTLAQAEAITEPSVKYQPYDKQRIAGFQPLQETAFGAAQGLQPSMLGAQAGQVAGAASLGALGAGYDPFQMGQFTSQAAGQYMNPYLEQAMAPQIREAQRAADIQRNIDQARAVGAGAFGGSRQAIVEAERQRNLGTQIGDIRARGYASAFDQAQQQFAREQQLREQSRQYGAGYGMQGLQTALQGAGMMGQLGGQQFGQAKDIIGLQSQLGAQQQALEQQKLSQDYQDFLAAKKFPYQQVEFLSNILRGTPMGGVSTLYGAQPTTAQTLGTLGTAAYGLSKFAEGGSVTSDENVEDILGKLSDAQLAQAKQIALAERDMKRVQMIDAEMAERASMKTGLGMAFNQLPQEQQDNVMSAAGGGIVAFAGDDDDNDPQTGQLVQTSYSPGSPADYQYFLEQGRQAYNALGQEVPYVAPTAAERARFRTEFIKEAEEGAGESPYVKLKTQLEEMRGERAGTLEQAKGLAALQAAAAMSQGRGFVQGLGRAAGVFGGAYGQALAADKAEKRALANMEFNILDAERKERMGLNKEAAAAMREVDRDKAAAAKARNDRLTAQANLARGMAAASKPHRPVTGGAKSPKEIDIAVATYLADIKEQYPDLSPARQRAMALQLYQERKSSGLPGVTAKTESTREEKARDRAAQRAYTDPELMAALRKKDSVAADARRRAILAEELARPEAPAAPAASASAPLGSAANPIKIPK